jgi:hypothetical protein
VQLVPAFELLSARALNLDVQSRRRPGVLVAVGFQLLLLTVERRARATLLRAADADVA